MKALEDGPPAVAAGFGVRQTGACRTRHGLRGRRYAVSSLELVGRGGLGRRLLDGLGELEVVVVDPLLRLVLFLTELLVGCLELADGVAERLFCVGELLLLPIDDYELLGICLMKMLPASVGVMGIMYVAGGLWSTLGVQLFGGTVYDGNPALEGTDYMEEGYDILNNNDYAMAFMSLFTFITAGPYHEFIEAAEAAIPVVGYLYHVSFYIVGILIVKEGLIVAFIVDAFLSQFEDNRALCEDENIASLDQSRAGEGFRIIASKRSSKDDIYRAMFLEDDD